MPDGEMLWEITEPEGEITIMVANAGGLVCQCMGKDCGVGDAGVDLIGVAGGYRVRRNSGRPSARRSGGRMARLFDRRFMFGDLWFRLRFRQRFLAQSAPPPPVAAALLAFLRVEFVRRPAGLFDWRRLFLRYHGRQHHQLYRVFLNGRCRARRIGECRGKHQGIQQESGALRPK